MIPELLGRGSAPTGILGERKVSIPNLPSPSSSSTCSSTAPSTTSVLNLLNTSNGGNNNLETTQNIKCPRCNSTNTKFCYYNNYNLTQPRHFCKMCRRYWTKGGTLRKIPIGGGCRRNKTTIASGLSTTSGILKSSSKAKAKAKASFSAEILVNGNSSFLGNGLMDHLHHHHHHPELQPAAPSPVIWPSLPQSQNSHILALLAGTTQFHNPSSPTSTVFTACFKTEGCTTLGLDSYVNGASSGCGSFQHHLNGGNDFVQINRGSSSNILELYQMLKSSANYSNSGNENPTVLEAASMGGGGDNTLGGYNIMNSAISSWSDFPIVPSYQ